MYKIFFNSRVLTIIEITDERINEKTDYNVANNAEEMLQLLRYFDTNPQIPSILIQVADKKDAFRWLLAYFTLVEAAGGLVQNSKGEYLIIYRFNHWDLPKGKCENNETLEETAIREVEEECNLNNLSLVDYITDRKSVV